MARGINRGEIWMHRFKAPDKRQRLEEFAANQLPYHPQYLHAGTVYSVELLAPRLDADGIVVDIGLLRTVLRAMLAPLDYQNLDEIPALAGENTTTEIGRSNSHRHGRAAAGSRQSAEPKMTNITTASPRLTAASAAIFQPVHEASSNSSAIGNIGRCSLCCCHKS